MKRRTVLSLEQALSMSYATLRFVQLGWRVIRLESTPVGSALPGDPNRYIGEEVADSDRRSYFIAPNVGKEAIALNLKHSAGRELLKTIVKELDVDIFCCNTLPSRYEFLGIDYETLKSAKPDIIWAAISAMGPDFPGVPGYDPAIQALAGFMELTGDLDGPPMLCGVPLIDLKAGDEVYANVCLALAEKAESGQGQAIHVSMMQAAASWLITTLPLLDFDCDPGEVTRCGNEHRKFIPVNVYPTTDRFVLIAIGNDVQWERLTKLPKFRALANDVRITNAGRHTERSSIHRDMAEVTRLCDSAGLIADLMTHKIPCAPIQTIAQVRDCLADKLTTTRTPSGKVVRLPPLPVDREQAVVDYPFAPRYSQDTRSILKQVGLSDDRLRQLVAQQVIPGP